MTRTRTPESQVLKQCLQLLRLRGVPAWRQNQGALRVGRRFVRFASAKGICDLIGCLPRAGGRMLCVEVKRPGGRLTPDQIGFLDGLAAAGALCLVISDPRQLDEALRAEGCY
jgi:hypothetical protein